MKGESVVCFVVLVGAGATTGPELREQVATALGKPLTPERVLFVSALPRTRTGKVMRRVIRAVYLGHDPGDLTALENPASLIELRRMR